VPRDQLDSIAANGLLQDEKRLFHVALTRAKGSLFVTAVQRDDEEPSQFFNDIDDSVNEPEFDVEANAEDNVLVNENLVERKFTEVPRPITSPALVAELRSQLHGENAQTAAEILKALSENGIYLANTESWIGSVPLSTDAPVIDADKEVVVSPSGAESFEECGVKWFLQKSGGTDKDNTAQLLGSAIHAFAAKMVQEPGTTEEELISKLKSSWKLIDPDSGWVSASHLENAVTMLEKFVEYHVNTTRKEVYAEMRFDVKLGRARIIGRVDRLEVEADGSLFIIDFKTGGSAISVKDAKANLQLATYQLGITEGGFPHGMINAGAELVYLGTSSAGATIRSQHDIDVDEVKSKLNEIGEGMGAATFFATINKRCKGCPVRKSCPVQSDGRTVIS
jgi:RecB family exonuclease